MPEDLTVQYWEQLPVCVIEMEERGQVLQDGSNCQTISVLLFSWTWEVTWFQFKKYYNICI